MASSQNERSCRSEFGQEVRVPRGGVSGFSPDVARRALDRHGMSAGDLAEAVGVTRQAVSAWLNGSKLPSVKSLAKVAEEVNLSPADLTPHVAGRPYLADLRARVGKTQAQVAADLSISPTVLSEIERGIHGVKDDVAAELAEVYDVPYETVWQAWDAGRVFKQSVSRARSATRRRAT